MSSATAIPKTAEVERQDGLVARSVYPLALAGAFSLWLFAFRAPLWLDETLAYWQVSGGFAKIWSRSAMMPSSFAYLYILWFDKAIFGGSEVAVRIPSMLAMLAAVYFLLRAAQLLMGREVALIAGILFCVHADIVFAANDARPYAFALLMTNLTIFALVRWTAGHEMRDAILCGASAAGILYFHYLFGAILPALAIYYLLLRGRSIKTDATQIAACLSAFVLVTAPQVPRFLGLFHNRQAHTFAGDPRAWFVLRALAPFKLLIIFVAATFVAALIRKVKLPGRGTPLAVLLCPLLGLIPVAVLYGISATTPMRVLIPRYCLVAAPGAALTWGFLISWLDSRRLRELCCVVLVTAAIFQSWTTPQAYRHESSFKPAHALVNANVAQDGAPVLVCSAFIESDFELLPTDRNAEDPLMSQVGYYPIEGTFTLLPMSVNDQAAGIAGEVTVAAAQRRQRFLVVAGPRSYPTVDWLTQSTRGVFVPHLLGDFDQIAVVEFRPVGAD